ncbi:PRC-barrel domain-containing protein [Derxia gummosa]|uniref:PRC-barrel domain-containing protein n=1 Tax=Derxia gummosa DSM 723 TaxID=1121388 RepID=A0AC36KJK0_9BURK
MDTITANNYLTRDRYGMYAGELSQGPGPRLMGADTLLGNDVYNHQDEKLGDIKEIMLDVPGGRIAYAVLSFGGFLTLGEKLFAVPWSALVLDTTAKCFRLDASKDRLKDAPGFDKDHWPSMADPTWSKDIDSFYSVGGVNTTGMTAGGAVGGVPTGYPDGRSGDSSYGTRAATDPASIAGNTLGGSTSSGATGIGPTGGTTGIGRATSPSSDASAVIGGSTSSLGDETPSVTSGKPVTPLI